MQHACQCAMEDDGGKRARGEGRGAWDKWTEDGGGDDEDGMAAAVLVARQGDDESDGVRRRRRWDYEADPSPS